MKFYLPKNKIIDLEKIDQLNAEGKSQQLKSLLFSYSKNFSKFSPQDQNIILGLLYNYSYPDEALKCVKNEMTPDEMKKSSDYKLLTQMRLARILLLLGCQKTSLRITKNILSEIYQRETIEGHACATILVLAATTFFDNQVFTDIEKCMEVFNLKNYEKEFPHLSNHMKFYVHHARNTLSTDNAINLQIYKELHENSDNHAFRDSLVIASVGIQMDFMLTKSESMLKFMNESSVFNTPEKQTWKHYYLSIIQLAEGKFELAKDSFTRSLELSRFKNIRYLLSYAFYNEVYEFRNELIADKVFLRCSPSVNAYSFMAGNRFLDEDIVKLPIMKIESTYLDDDIHDYDSWLIGNGQIKKIKYSEYQNTRSSLDLVSGMFLEKDKKTTLTPVRTKCLIPIIGSGSFGVHEILIAERTYENEVFYPESARLRIRTLVNQIERMGIKIKRMKGHVYFDFDLNNFEIVFPRNHVFQDKFSFVKKSLPFINIKNLSDCLAIKPSTASLYIKQWRDEGLISVMETSRYGDYKINTQSQAR